MSSQPCTAAAPMTLADAGERLLMQRALRDPYYRTMAEQGATPARLRAAGLFLDNCPVPIQEHPCWSVAMPTTPVGKLLDALVDVPRDAEPVVLLSTGSFSPVHQGHLAMMECARHALTGAGRLVVGGYLSASHDEYVDVKLGGAAAMHAENRLALLEEAVAESSWLSVCPWEARYAPVALNFTDVLLRLQSYLCRQLGWSIRVAYVFGSDNVGFIEAFRSKGLAVCVQRGPLAAEARALKQHVLSDDTLCRRLLFTEPTKFHGASSTQVRGGERALLPAPVLARYTALRDRTVASERGPEPPPLYLLRHDLAYGLQQWPGVAPASADAFQHGLAIALAPALQLAGYELQALPLEDQQSLCAQLESAAPVLSLDACVRGTHQLHLSRRFDLSDGQVRSRTMSQRPGSAPLLQQVAQLPQSEQTWTVVDDDTSTGQTELFVRILLQTNGCQSARFRYLNEALLASKGLADREVADVVDARDFLLGARDGGLVVRLPGGQLARAPYMMPFVNLSFRACLPGVTLKTTSIELWRLNAHWFDVQPRALAVKDAFAPSQELLYALGFSSTVPLAQVCRHMERWLQATQHWAGLATTPPALQGERP